MVHVNNTLVEFSMKTTDVRRHRVNSADISQSTLSQGVTKIPDITDSYVKNKTIQNCSRKV